MAQIRAKNHCDDNYDGYGNTAIAVLEVNGVSIPLSQDSVDELRESLNEFDNTIFCHKCNNFIMSQYGWNYGGSCQHQANEGGVLITKENAGYQYCVDCMGTCPSGRLRTEE